MATLVEVVREAAAYKGLDAEQLLTPYRRHAVDIPFAEAWMVLESADFEARARNAAEYFGALKHRFALVADEKGAVEHLFALTRALQSGLLPEESYNSLMQQPVAYFWHHDCIDTVLIDQEVFGVPLQYAGVAERLCRFAAEQMPAPHPLINLNTIFSSTDFYDIAIPDWYEALLQEYGEANGIINLDNLGKMRSVPRGSDARIKFFDRYVGERHRASTLGELLDAFDQPIHKMVFPLGYFWRDISWQERLVEHVVSGDISVSPSCAAALRERLDSRLTSPLAAPAIFAYMAHRGIEAGEIAGLYRQEGGARGINAPTLLADFLEERAECASRLPAD